MNMLVKLDTKEKFHVITILEPVLTANMTEDLERTFNESTQNGVKNVIMNLAGVSEMDLKTAMKLCSMQQNSYENNHSLVFCSLQKDLEQWLDKQEVLELMNVTPTESEAMDIVQMEEIEREMFGE
jgi:anti-anti-sigma regulatory factor